MTNIRRPAIAAARAIFRLCQRHPHPPCAFSRASSKVGYLARRGRPALHHLESALNEQKHLIVVTRLGRDDLALEHRAARDAELEAFRRAVYRLSTNSG